MEKMNHESKVLLNVHKRYCTILRLIKKIRGQGGGAIFELKTLQVI